MAGALLSQGALAAGASDVSPNPYTTQGCNGGCNGSCNGNCAGPKPKPTPEPKPKPEPKPEPAPESTLQQKALFFKG
jgi:hypothetical protein